MPDHTTTETRRPAGKTAMFTAFSSHNFRLFWFGMVAYVTGWNVEYVTFNWAMWELTHDPLSLGYLGIAQGLPVLVLQLFGGVFADRVQRLPLIIATYGASTLIICVALALAVTGLLRLEHLLLLSVVSGVARAFETPSRLALIPQLVERQHLANAMALNQLPWQTGRIVGPSVAGVLIAAFGSGVGFGLSALGYAATLALNTRIRVLNYVLTGAGQSVLRNLLDGLSYVGRSPLLLRLIMLTFANSLFGMSYVTLLPIFADQYMGAGSTGYGLLHAAQGIGAMIGTLTLAWVAHRLRRDAGILVGGVGFGLGLMAFSQSPTLPIALGAVAIMSFCNIFYITIIGTTVQEQAPNELRGRVMGLWSTAWNLIPLGGILGGVLATMVDARFAVLLGGAIVVATALTTALSKSIRAT